MLAKQNDFIDDAASTIYQLTQEEQIRLQCIAREDYYKRQRTVHALMEQKEAAIKEQQDTINEQHASIKRLSTENDLLQNEINDLKQKLAAAKEQLDSHR